MSKTAEIHLPYFKRGDDLGQALEKSGSIAEALELHASWLESAAKQLREIKSVVEKHNVEVHIQADTHFIGIEGPEELIDELMSKELAHPDPFPLEEEELDEAELSEAEA